MPSGKYDRRAILPARLGRCRGRQELTRERTDFHTQLNGAGEESESREQPGHDHEPPKSGLENCRPRRIDSPSRSLPTVRAKWIKMRSDFNIEVSISPTQSSPHNIIQSQLRAITTFISSNPFTSENTAANCFS